MLAGEYSINAKLLYGLLLNRTMLSQKSGWVSEDGNVYVIYTIKQMANDLDRSERTVKTALRELGLEPGSLSAILITHTHADHISGLQTLLKRCAAPVFTTERAARELSWRLPGAAVMRWAASFCTITVMWRMGSFSSKRRIRMGLVM